MYAKVFRQIYDSTLAEDWRALVTFQQLLVLADSEGLVDMTPGAIHRVTNIPSEIIDAGIEKLQQPDPHSRSDSEEGRRIVLIDPSRNWGWRIVNHEKYKEIRSQEDRREYMRDYMRGYRKQTVNNCKTELAQLADTDTDVDTDTEKKTTYASLQLAPCPREEILKLYHEMLPVCPRVEKWTDSRERLLKVRWREHPNIDLWRQFFKIVQNSKFLTGRTRGSGDRPPFLADFGWLIRPENFAKVMEGKYDDRKQMP